MKSGDGVCMYRLVGLCLHWSQQTAQYPSVAFSSCLSDSFYFHFLSIQPPVNQRSAESREERAEEVLFAACPCAYMRVCVFV